MLRLDITGFTEREVLEILALHLSNKSDVIQAKIDALRGSVKPPTVVKTSPPKRKLSAAALASIRAGQKKRWSKKESKKAAAKKDAPVKARKPRKTKGAKIDLTAPAPEPAAEPEMATAE